MKRIVILLLMSVILSCTPGTVVKSHTVKVTFANGDIENINYKIYCDYCNLSFLTNDGNGYLEVNCILRSHRHTVATNVRSYK